MPEETKFIALGYDGTQVGNSSRFDTAGEVQEFVKEQGWEKHESDIVIARCRVRDGQIVHEAVAKVLKGSGGVFLHGIRMRNEAADRAAGRD